MPVDDVSLAGAASNDTLDVRPRAVVEPSKPRLLPILAPGLITGASNDDPSGIATDSQASAAFGYLLHRVVAVPVPTVMMLIARRRDIMGEWVIGGWFRLLGWLASATLPVSVIASLGLMVL